MNDFDDFDKTFKRMGTGIVLAWIIGVLASLAVSVAVIWGIVQVVQAVTA